ncbi:MULTISPECIES: STAS domain-containing protein [Rhodococcus]|uniref:STAS domain-containing protein n=1 Tax=Rhodococcus TaxID=1827 RepID=UPI001E2E6F0E|nr:MULTISPECIES: STAS domain-containing protein [Rhodococcus]MCD2107756.1 anti-anti-sigma factor [Rhodococcus qingshengii]MCZ4524794.1 anti-anti-sigma factor [Rhodococcus erythropolis]MDV8007721.1 anti-anti-sigma factor [Rhodococcus sp. IEGM 1318]MDZ7914665.1 anti-anti-sigma factor [Rhodococcus sp. (in: high G+C Gram-positive bacteria)]
MNLNELDHTSIDSIDPSTQLGPILETQGFAAWRVAPSTVLIQVNVDLDRLSAPEVQELLSSYAAEWTRVIFDLSNSLFVGAVCLELFAELNSRSRTHDFQWSVIGSHPLRRLLRAARAEEEFPVTNSVEAAMRALREAEKSLEVS